MKPRHPIDYDAWLLSGEGGPNDDCEDRPDREEPEYDPPDYDDHMQYDEEGQQL